MNEMLSLGMKRHAVQFTLIAARRSPTYLDVSANEIALIFVPFGDKLLKVIRCHSSAMKIGRTRAE